MNLISPNANTSLPPFFSNSCDNQLIPEARRYLTEVERNVLIVIMVCAFVGLLTCLVFIEARWHIVHEMAKWKPKNKALLLLGMYPVTSINALVGLLLPRASGLTDLVTAVYFSLCIYVFSQMLIGHYGGKEKMVRRLAGEKIKLSNPPLLCCCFCLPEVEVNIKNLRVFEILIMQFVVLRPIFAYIMAVFIIDSGPNYLFGSSDSSSVIFTGTSLATTASTFLAIYGNFCLFKISIKPLEHVRIYPKFYLVQAAVLLDNIQRLLLDVLVTFDVVVCDPPLNTTATRQRIHQVLLVFEMFFLMLVARIYYRVTALERRMPPEDLQRQESVNRGVGTSFSSALSPGNRLSSPTSDSYEQSTNLGHVNAGVDTSIESDLHYLEVPGKTGHANTMQRLSYDEASPEMRERMGFPV